MTSWFASQPVLLQALLAGLFTWSVTALGAGTVFINRAVSQRLLDAMLGFAAGVMVAASFWSLLLPAIEIAEAQGRTAWLVAAGGFLAGGAVLRLADAVLPHLHPGLSTEQAEGLSTTWQRSTLLVLAITLHNIPEGLAVGVTFGAVAAGLDASTGTSLGAALALALGIGLQNFPEGVAVAFPLRGDGLSRFKSFWYGQLSGIVEPVAAVVGAVAVTAMRPVLPFALAFAAGAMIFVVVEELIPESHLHGHEDLATSSALLGFTVMMVLDVALG